MFPISKYFGKYLLSLESKLYTLSTINTQKNLVFLPIFGQLCHQGKTESFCNFAKGQIVSEGNFGVFKSPKKQTKFLERFLPWPLKLSHNIIIICSTNLELGVIWYIISAIIFWFHLYSSVPKRRACTFINFGKKIHPARPYFGLHVYWFWEKIPPALLFRTARLFHPACLLILVWRIEG